jgi:hypothetical protein
MREIMIKKAYAAAATRLAAFLPRISTVAVILALAGATDAVATTYYVAANGNDTTGTGTSGNPYRTISKAASLVNPGDTVYVGNGTYPGSFTTSRSGSSSAQIRYISTNKWGAKVIPPANSGSSIAWNNTASYVTIQGFDVDGRNPQAGTVWRTGIASTGAYSKILANHVQYIAQTVPCTSTGGSGINANAYPGATGAYGEWIDIQDNLVHDVGPFDCAYIGGIYMSTKGTVKNNLIYNVELYGIQTYHDIRNCDFVNNTVVDCGAGIYIGNGATYYTNWGPTGDYVHVENNLVAHVRKRGIYEGGNWGTHNTFKNNLVYDWGSATYPNPQQTNVTVAPNAQPPITSNPQFTDYANQNFTVLSSSPAVNAGNATYAPPVDRKGVARPQGAADDIGAYER